MREILYTVLMWAICAFATIKGGWPQRVVALTLLTGSGLTAILLPSISERFQHVETAVLIVDVIVFLIFFGVGLFSRRYWPIWIAAMQGVSLLGHFIPLMPLAMPYIYANYIALWSWPMLLILALSTLQRGLHPTANSGLPR